MTKRDVVMPHQLYVNVAEASRGISCDGTRGSNSAELAVCVNG